MFNKDQYQTREQDAQDQKRNGVSPSFIAKVIAEQQSKDQQSRN